MGSLPPTPPINSARVSFANLLTLSRAHARARPSGGVFCVVLSLRVFWLEIYWSLSFGVWWPRNLARRLRRRAAARPARAADFVLVELLIGDSGRRWLGLLAAAQPVLDDEDDPADDPPVINPGNTMRQWEKPFDRAHLRLGEQE